jgi:two-component system, response regulator PdtaR
MVDAPSPRATLLLVDDDRLILFTLAEALRAMGFDVLSASSGEAALKLAREANPDLAVCDVRMPGMSGLVLARHLREETKVPFIFLSAYSSDEEGGRLAAEHGALGYLMKPVDVTSILPTIQAALARAAELRN